MYSIYWYMFILAFFILFTNFLIFLIRFNIILILIFIEIIVFYLNVNIIIISIFYNDLLGQIFSLFIISMAGIEISLGLILFIIYYKNYDIIYLNSLNILKS